MTRSKDETIHDILTLCMNGKKPTEVTRFCNISYVKYQYYGELLERLGYVTVTGAGWYSRRVVIKTTDEGIDFIDDYEKLRHNHKELFECLRK